jgi:hypothetical protein
VQGQSVNARHRCYRDSLQGIRGKR